MDTYADTIADLVYRGDVYSNSYTLNRLSGLLMFQKPKCFNIVIFSPGPLDDNRREVPARFYKGHNKVADQNQTQPVFWACTKD